MAPGNYDKFVYIFRAEVAKFLRRSR